MDFNGAFKFYVYKKNGYVVSERALKEVPLAVEGIIKEKVKMSDWLIINGPAEIVKELKIELNKSRILKSKVIIKLINFIYTKIKI